MKNRKRPVNIVVLVDSIDRQRLRGILRFALGHPEWNIRLVPEHPANRFSASLDEWPPDGIIATEYMLSLFGKVKALRNTRYAVLIDADRPSPFLPHARQVLLANDNEAIGRLAAQHYLARGFHHLAYAHMLLPRHWSDKRASAFAATARSAGCSCDILGPNKRESKNWQAEEQRLIHWIRALPRPCGILGANDGRAIQILHACELADIRVPEGIAVCGVDNDDIFCGFARPTLSSIQIEFEKSGFMAAEALQRLLSGSRGRKNSILYGNPILVERDSTWDSHGSAHIIARAHDYMDTHANQSVGIHDIANALGISARTLERRFRIAGIPAPGALLRNSRLTTACDLLKSTTMPLGNIHERCGFASAASMSNAFKKAMNMTMSQYRSACRSKRTVSSPPRGSRQG